jgi:hypothetical protein
MSLFVTLFRSVPSLNWTGLMSPQPEAAGLPKTAK